MKLSEMKSSDEQKKKTFEENYNNLKDCSSDELMRKLQNEIAEQKRNGTFDFEGLKNTIEQVKLYLPTQTYENMMRIIENLK